jgi:hypothetical protein
MAETITIAGKKLPKTGVYVAGAGVVGIVGYAWWSKGRDDFAAQQAAIDEKLPGPIEAPTDEPGFDVVGGVGPPKTNADWNATAIEKLMNIGVDAVAAQAAIGKFLQRRFLTVAEASLVEQAIAAAGYPPENGPWVILRAPIPGPTTPAPVTPPPGTKPPPTTSTKPGAAGFVNITKTGRSTYNINFVPPGNATQFRYRRIAGGKGSAWSGVYGRGIIITSGKFKGIAQIKARALFTRRTTFTVGVICGNAKGWGPEARSRNSITLP